MKLKAAALVLALAASPPGAAAQNFLPSASEAEALRERLRDGAITEAATFLHERCGLLLQDSRDATQTVSVRAAKAREALQCARTVAASSVALAEREDALVATRLLDTSVEAYAENQAKAESEENFLGLNWGVGLGLSVPFETTVSEAAIVDGIVRTKTERREEPRVFLEYHKYFWWNDDERDGTRGLGPFVAAVASEDDVLSGVALGLMIGRKTAVSDTDGFSIGFGAVLDAAVPDLGEGFDPDLAPPNGETEVRFTSRSRWSFAVFVTRTF